MNNAIERMNYRSRTELRFNDRMRYSGFYISSNTGYYQLAFRANSD